MAKTNPTEIAHEALKQLRIRKLAPTPDNFERVYHELTNKPLLDRENKLAQQLMAQLEHLPEHTNDKKRKIRLKKEIANQHWDMVSQLVIEWVQHDTKRSEASMTQPWGKVIRDLMQAWDIYHPDMSRHHKQTALNRVLINYEKNPTELNKKLIALTRHWGITQAGAPDEYAFSEEFIPDDDDSSLEEEKKEEPRSAAEDDAIDEVWQAWQRVLSLTLQHGIEPHLSAFPDLMPRLKTLMQDIDGVNNLNLLETFSAQLGALLLKLQMQASSNEAGNGTAKSSLGNMVNSFRSLLDNVVSRLATAAPHADETPRPQEGLPNHSDKIQDKKELHETIQALLNEINEIQASLMTSYKTILTEGSQDNTIEERAKELEETLAKSDPSTPTYIDPLTGAYQYYLLAELFRHEISRTQRTGSALSVAVIDTEHYRQMSKQYKHLTGGNAFKYLEEVIRQKSRAMDLITRVGIKEVVLLMPNTPVQSAIASIERLQRELTKIFFLSNGERLVVTFSAGVAQWHSGDSDSDMIERATQAMFQAKLAGKNKVFSAETDKTR